jgi:hypothetical protein
VVCPCGRVFEVLRSKFERGRGRRCSKACKNLYATRPSGLTYVKHKPGGNPTSFKPGEHRSPETEFRRGHMTWNKGFTGTHFSSATEFKLGENAGELNNRWASDEVGYSGLHLRVRQVRGPASDRECLYQDGTCKGPIQWANISHEYWDISDFMPLCQSHHVRYDRAYAQSGAMS